MFFCRWLKTKICRPCSGLGVHCFGAGSAVVEALRPLFIDLVACRTASEVVRALIAC
jgi:hypothetical protein